MFFAESSYPDDLPDFDNTVATHLYRIAQEATTNAIQHGSADKIVISHAFGPRVLLLEIADNGIGFDKAKMA
jgi:two-component system sensor kinase FixL